MSCCWRVMLQAKPKTCNEGAPRPTPRSATPFFPKLSLQHSVHGTAGSMLDMGCHARAAAAIMAVFIARGYTEYSEGLRR